MTDQPVDCPQCLAGKAGSNVPRARSEVSVVCENAATLAARGSRSEENFVGLIENPGCLSLVSRRDSECKTDDWEEKLQKAAKRRREIIP